MSWSDFGVITMVGGCILYALCIILGVFGMHVGCMLDVFWVYLLCMWGAFWWHLGCISGEFLCMLDAFCVHFTCTKNASHMRPNAPKMHTKRIITSTTMHPKCT
jgi:hypothetical protein